MGGGGNEDPHDKDVDELKLARDDEPNKPDGRDDKPKIPNGEGGNL